MFLKKKKVIIAISGGVDSSVAAQLLKNKGYDVTGIFLHFWKEDVGGQEMENKCCSMKSLMDARMVCEKIGIPFYTLNFAKEFKKEIVDNFINEYKIGNTPNPCVLCNEKVKLGLLIKYAKKLGFDYVASGHYANLKRVGRNLFLAKAKDKTKDQTYFLYRLNQEQLRHLKFPLGNFLKTEVRGLAKKYKLPVANKHESQEICFINSKSHNDFLKRHLELKKGLIKDLNGKVMAEHDGLPLYTLGQRRGIEIGGIGPFYVIKLDYKNNVLYVSNKKDDEILYAKKIKFKNPVWTNSKLKINNLKCEAIFRYGHKSVKCLVNKNEVIFNEKQRSLTPGQSIVFYYKNRILGGGIIE